MKNLVKALTILNRYGNPKFPLSFKKGILTILDIDTNAITREDRAELLECGFWIKDKKIYSYKYVK